MYNQPEKVHERRRHKRRRKNGRQETTRTKTMNNENPRGESTKTRVIIESEKNTNRLPRQESAITTCIGHWSRLQRINTGHKPNTRALTLSMDKDEYVASTNLLQARICRKKESVASNNLSLFSQDLGNVQYRQFPEPLVNTKKWQKMLD